MPAVPGEDSLLRRHCAQHRLRQVTLDLQVDEIVGGGCLDQALVPRAPVAVVAAPLVGRPQRVEQLGSEGPAQRLGIEVADQVGAHLEAVGPGQAGPALRRQAVGRGRQAADHERATRIQLKKPPFRSGRRHFAREEAPSRTAAGRKARLTLREDDAARPTTSALRARCAVRRPPERRCLASARRRVRVASTSAGLHQPHSALSRRGAAAQAAGLRRRRARRSGCRWYRRNRTNSSERRRSPSGAPRLARSPGRSLRWARRD